MKSAVPWKVTATLDRTTSRFSLPEMVYFARYAFECLILRKQKPIAAGVPLTNDCNLSCRHCVIKNEKSGPNSFRQITEWIRDLYIAGARTLYLQGGEILLWKEGALRPNDIIRFARKTGYFHVAAVTNGTLPIDLAVDALWVSTDGPPEIHDRIRGQDAFARMQENVSACSHKRLYANLTINGINAGYIEETIAAIEAIGNFRGISVNFHTPYPGTEDLDLPQPERALIVSRLLALKRKGHRILNSAAGLRLLATGRYRRPIRMIQMVEQGRVFECCFGSGQKGVCERCGYGVIAELAAIAHLRPSAILQALSLF